MSEDIDFIEETEERLAELATRFEERGFFKRLGDMFAGLGQPKDTREYKLARIELQRLSAPLIAIVVPVLFVVVLIVVTAIQGQQKRVIQVDVAHLEEETTEVKEEDPPPPEEIEPEPMEDVEIVFDNPTPGPVSNLDPTPSPPSKQLSVKPAPVDAVALVNSPVKMKSIMGSRTPGQRGARTSGGANNGDQYTEAAVMKALRWLKHTQKSDGSWPGGLSNTGLAVLAFLAHGETPATSKEFGNTVKLAIQNLCDNQFIAPDGTVKFRGTDGHEYAYLIATYALCEAYGMTHNPNAKEAAYNALRRIVDNQSPTGGWDYNMVKTSTRDDMSFEGWALQAIKAGKMAGLHPEGLEECIKKAIRCLKTRNFKNGGFNYTAGGNPTGLTATGCLCMQLLGYGAQPEVGAALEYMRNWNPTFTISGTPGDTPGAAPQYYCYYAAQCKFQAGMKNGATAVDLKSWQAWNAAMKALYPKTIITLPEKILGPDGKEHEMGYWKNSDAHGCGETMSTCLCALQLMVYYRYLPTTQAVNETATEDAAADAATQKAIRGGDVDVTVDI